MLDSVWRRKALTLVLIAAAVPAFAQFDLLGGQGGGLLGAVTKAVTAMHPPRWLQGKWSTRAGAIHFNVTANNVVWEEKGDVNQLIADHTEKNDTTNNIYTLSGALSGTQWIFTKTADGVSFLRQDKNGSDGPANLVLSMPSKTAQSRQTASPTKRQEPDFIAKTREPPWAVLHPPKWLLGYWQVPADRGTRNKVNGFQVELNPDLPASPPGFWVYDKGVRSIPYNATYLNYAPFVLDGVLLRNSTSDRDSSYNERIGVDAKGTVIWQRVGSDDVNLSAKNVPVEDIAYVNWGIARLTYDVKSDSTQGDTYAVTLEPKASDDLPNFKNVQKTGLFKLTFRKSGTDRLTVTATQTLYLRRDGTPLPAAQQDYSTLDVNTYYKLADVSFSADFERREPPSGPAASSGTLHSIIPPSWLLGTWFQINPNSDALFGGNSKKGLWTGVLADVSTAFPPEALSTLLNTQISEPSYNPVTVSMDGFTGIASARLWPPLHGETSGDRFAVTTDDGMFQWVFTKTASGIDFKQIQWGKQTVTANMLVSDADYQAKADALSIKKDAPVPAWLKGHWETSKGDAVFDVSGKLVTWKGQGTSAALLPDAQTELYAPFGEDVTLNQRYTIRSEKAGLQWQFFAMGYGTQFGQSSLHGSGSDASFTLLNPQYARLLQEQEKAAAAAQAQMAQFRDLLAAANQNAAQTAEGTAAPHMLHPPFWLQGLWTWHDEYVIKAPDVSVPLVSYAYIHKNGIYSNAMGAGEFDAAADQMARPLTDDVGATYVVSSTRAAGEGGFSNIILAVVGSQSKNASSEMLNRSIKGNTYYTKWTFSPTADPDKIQVTPESDGKPGKVITLTRFGGDTVAGTLHPPLWLQGHWIGKYTQAEMLVTTDNFREFAPGFPPLRLFNFAFTAPVTDQVKDANTYLVSQPMPDGTLQTWTFTSKGDSLSATLSYATKDGKTIKGAEMVYSRVAASGTQRNFYHFDEIKLQPGGLAVGPKDTLYGVASDVFGRSVIRTKQLPDNPASDYAGPTFAYVGPRAGLGLPESVPQVDTPFPDPPNADPGPRLRVDAKGNVFAYGGGTVFRPSGETWTAVADLSSLNLGHLDAFEVSPDGVFYAAFIDAGQGNKASVARWNGKTWEVVGNAGFTGPHPFNLSLSFDQKGQPVLIDNAAEMKKSTITWDTYSQTDGIQKGPFKPVNTYVPTDTVEVWQWADQWSRARSLTYKSDSQPRERMLLAQMDKNHTFAKGLPLELPADGSQVGWGDSGVQAGPWGNHDSDHEIQYLLSPSGRVVAVDAKGIQVETGGKWSPVIAPADGSKNVSLVRAFDGSVYTTVIPVSTSYSRLKLLGGVQAGGGLQYTTESGPHTFTLTPIP